MLILRIEMPKHHLWKCQFKERKEMSKKLHIGYTDNKVDDLAHVAHVTSLPASVAVQWIKEKCPEVDMGLGCLGKDLVVEDSVVPGWKNKVYIIVEVSAMYEHWLVLNNHDDVFSLKTLKI